MKDLNAFYVKFKGRYTNKFAFPCLRRTQVGSGRKKTGEGAESFRSEVVVKTKKRYICLLSAGILKRGRGGLGNGADRNQINAPEKLYDSSPPSRPPAVIA